MPRDDDPELDESGYRIPTSASDRGLTTVDDDTVYEIDRILSAEKVDGRYRLWIKWKDHADASPEWKSDIERQTSHPGLLQEIQDAVQRCREQLNEGREDDDPVVRDELAAELPRASITPESSEMAPLLRLATLMRLLGTPPPGFHGRHASRNDCAWCALVSK
eukprot:2535861-Prymnesium_polylepis.1